MPRNATTGVYSAPSNSWNPAVAGTVIDPDDWNDTQDDYVDGLNSLPHFSDGGAIDDNNGNELLEFDVTASAVNHIKVTNAATGNDPVLSAAGGDTDIDLVLAGQGTGIPKIGANKIVAGPASATDNGFVKWDGTTGALVKDSAAVVPLGSGGTGRALSDPGADRILFWDDSESKVDWLTAGTNLSISGTTLNASGGGGGSPSPPQGRLTLTTGVPVLSGDVAGATTIYYTPYLGQFVPLYDGSDFNSADTGGELSQATTDNTKSPAAAANNSNYDLFVWDDSGTIRCTRGPAWSSGTSRGTGAGTTELVRVQGLYLNANNITNGPVAQRGTYVGTVRTNGSAAVDWIYPAVAAGGTAGRFCVWNNFNRALVAGRVGESASSWNYNTNSYRPYNNSANNAISVVIGISEDAVTLNANGLAANSGSNATGVGIGLNSTSANSAQTMLAAAAATAAPNLAMYSGLPGIGFFTATMLEIGGSAGTSTFYGQLVSWSQAGLVIQFRM